ncbi:MAG: hypothetical protein A2017_11705 [Lentisphaerae bacterium GWF2_44_16]|nr:MAG: hypothetical protein A2017_11705 [Lentisphaerae bacterium GWF2_44_16]
MRHLGYFLVIFACLQLIPMTNAENKTSESVKINSDLPEVPVRAESLVSMIGRKFARGLTNAVTGSGEIPRQMIISYTDDGPALFIPVGFFTGVFMTVVRTTYGAVEAATCPAPIRGSYESYLVPAYVWGPVNR